MSESIQIIHQYLSSVQAALLGKPKSLMACLMALLDPDSITALKALTQINQWFWRRLAGVGEAILALWWVESTITFFL